MNTQTLPKSIVIEGVNDDQPLKVGMQVIIRGNRDGYNLPHDWSAIVTVESIDGAFCSIKRLSSSHVTPGICASTTRELQEYYMF